ncbi:MAG: Ig-like domain-containing protein, partial [Gemmatimonadetes bacterium]|nr:Ig-like domain-containing protein [Gemmatimonadota bacterium]
MRHLLRFPVALLLATGLLSMCKLGELVEPPPPAKLVVSPAEVVDSAAVGSTLSHGQSIEVRSDGAPGVGWRASVARSGPWLTLNRVQDTAPSTMSVALSPDGLGRGTYQDTIVVSSGDRADDVVKVPVVFMIRPCAERPIGLDTVVSDTLTPTDCTAPHRGGHTARVYSLAASAGDSVSVTLSSSAFDAYLVLDSTSGGPPLGENDACANGGRDACLKYRLLPRTGRYLIEATTAKPGEQGAFRLQVRRPHPPESPASLAQFRADSATSVLTGEATASSTVVLRATLADPDGDQVRLEVEVKPVGAEFTGTGTAVSAAVSSGAGATARVSGLADGTSYHWRARAIDQTGRPGPWAAYGGNAEDEADFTVRIQQEPHPPSGLGQFRIDGVTAIAVGGTTDERTVVFRGTVSDPNSGDPLRLEVEVKPVGTAFDNTPTASSPEVANGLPASAAVSGLNDNTSYRWQARAADRAGNRSPWVTYGGNAETAADFTVILPATRLAFVTQPTTATAGALLSPVRVAAQDALGNTLVSFAGTVEIAIGTNPSGGTLSGTKMASAVNGVATFSDLRIDRAGAGYTLAASASGLPSVTSAEFDVTPGPAAKLVFTAPPTDATAGATISPAVEVAALDALGNPATGFSGEVTVAIGSNPGGGRLAGTTVVAAIAGAASFADLSIDKAGSGYTLTAGATGLAGATSGAFAVAPGPATNLQFVVQPTSTAAGEAISPAVKVGAFDAYGNAATTFATDVTVSLGANPAGGTLSGTTVVKATSGVATFPDLSIDRAGSDYALAVSAAGVTGAVSTPFAVTTGAVSATLSTVTASPDAITASDGSSRATITVTARDGSGNLVSGISVTLASTGTGNTLTPALGTTGADGVMTALFNSTRAESKTISATIGGVLVNDKATVAVSAADPSSLAFTVQPTNTTAGAAITPAVQVAAQDDYGNTTTTFTNDVTVAIGSNPSGGTLSGTATVRPAEGVATFSNLSIDKAGADYTLVASADGLAGVTSAAFAVTVGSVSKLVFAVEPTNTVAGAVI